MSHDRAEIAPSLTRTGFVLIITLAWGWFALRSVGIALGLIDMPPFSDSKFMRLIFYEICAGGLIFYLLRKKGWPLTWKALGISRSSTISGGFLLAGVLVLSNAVYGIALSLGGNLRPLYDISASITVSRSLAVISSIVNGTYEELILVGFIFRALENRALPVIIGTSVVLRVIAHVYQGSVGALSILFLGVWFALVYAQERRMWTLIMAHIICDMLALVR